MCGLIRLQAPKRSKHFPGAHQVGTAGQTEPYIEVPDFGNTTISDMVELGALTGLTFGTDLRKICSRKEFRFIKTYYLLSQDNIAKCSPSYIQLNAKIYLERTHSRL